MDQQQVEYLYAGVTIRMFACLCLVPKASIYSLDCSLAISPSFLLPLSGLVALLNATIVDLIYHVPGRNSRNRILLVSPARYCVHS